MIDLTLFPAEPWPCSPYLARPCRPLHVALRDVAELRGLGLKEADALVVPEERK